MTFKPMKPVITLHGLTMREQRIDVAVRRQIHPQWRRHFAIYPADLGSVVFRDTKDTALSAIRAEFSRCPYECCLGA